MITLGIHDGHTATACLLVDGAIAACISEERLSRTKEDGGFPRRAIQACLDLAGVAPEEIDGVAIAGLMQPTLHENYDESTTYKKAFSLGSKVLPESVLIDDKWVDVALKVGHRKRNVARIEAHLAELGIMARPKFYEHHFLHAVTAHYTAHFGCERNLVLTNDGSGDATAATVNIGTTTKLERIARISNYNSIGEFYTRTTQFLGMKPMSHEYKVMGLAPYAKEKYARQTYEKIRGFFEFNGNPLVFQNRSGYCRERYLDLFKELFARQRFDNISWAVQQLVEDLLVQWVKNAIRETGIHRLVLSGGVFMNVKANNKLLLLDEVEELFIFPSGGDESLPIGAAIAMSMELGFTDIQPLGPLYLGPEIDAAEAREVAAKAGAEFSVTEPENMDEFLAEQLAAGKILARCIGRMEWGARALGNRSIIADASDRSILNRINKAIKNRDFWMPFAPSILHERVDDYLINPKNFFAPYMVVAMETKEAAQCDLAAAIHPSDFTARPQMVAEEWNPGYYRMIKAFERRTGRGGILNTSFNIHGEPIAMTASDAYDTFARSDLDGVAIGPVFISRYQPGER